MTNGMAALHVHSEYSPLDSVASTMDIARRAKELGLTAVSITDHGTLAGHREFQRSTKECGIKPILGEELYFSETDRFDKRDKASRQDGTAIYVHLIALAMNDNGLKNLQALDREAWKSYYYKPRMDFEVLEQYHEDIIFTSACMGGLLGKAILRGDSDYAFEQAKKFKDLLGDRYYIELQTHNPRELNIALLELADSLNIKPIISEDSHYAYPDQKELEEIFLVLSTNPKMNKEANYEFAQKLPLLERLNYLYPNRNMTFENLSLYIGGYDLRKAELLKQGIDREDLFENTVEISSRVEEYSYEENLDTLPELYDNSNKVLREKVQTGLKKLGLDNKQEYIDRMELELDVITGKSFSNYFLVLEDFLSWARSQKIRIGKGRGSAAASLVCYALGITGIDPIEHHLLFFRFLDPSRPDWPDADIDIMDSRRGEVKEYLTNKYGHVASITTINRYQGKVAIKDAARALGIPFGVVSKATKVLEGVDEVTGADAIAIFEKSNQAKEFNIKYPDVINIAKQLKGKIKGYGMHAAGVVLAKRPLSDYAPIETRKSPGSDVRVEVVGLDYRECEKLGLIKIDLLGLKNLTVIDETIKIIKDATGTYIDIDNIPMDDHKAYKMVADGKTLGIFQFEQPASMKLCTRVKPSNFDDFVSITSLVRPGAWDAIGEEFLDIRNGKKKARSIHADVDYFMESTYNLPLFQEQLMKLCVELAGLTDADANKIRKGVGKKIREIINEYKPKFIKGAMKKISEERAEKIWESFEAAGAYMFNLAHSTAYAVLTYQTAWLKANYPKEFMCAVLRSESNKDRITDYLIECKQMGIGIKLPHINHSDLTFSIEGDSLRFGLSSIKYISDKIGQRIIKLRPYSSYNEFKNKVLEKGSGMNTRTLQALNSFGGAAFDDNPRPENYKEALYEYLGIPAFESNAITSNMMESITSLEEFDSEDTMIVIAMVKAVVRKNGWCRIDMVDSTGTAGVFTNPDNDIEKNKLYLMIIGNNSIIKYFSLDKEIDKYGQEILDYLRRPSLNDVEPGQYKIIAAISQKTSTGNDKAAIVVSDQNKNLKTIMAYGQAFHKARLLAKIGSIRVITTKMWKNSLVLEDIY